MFSSQTQARVRVSCLIVSRGTRSSSFGNNHPCSAPSMTPWSLSLSFALVACCVSSNTCRNNNQIKMVYCCMMYDVSIENPEFFERERLGRLEAQQACSTAGCSPPDALVLVVGGVCWILYLYWGGVRWQEWDDRSSRSHTNRRNNG